MNPKPAKDVGRSEGGGQPGGLTEGSRWSLRAEGGGDHRKRASVGPAPRTGVPDPTRRRLNGPALKVTWPAVPTESNRLWEKANLQPVRQR